MKIFRTINGINHEINLTRLEILCCAEDIRKMSFENELLKKLRRDKTNSLPYSEKDISKIVDCANELYMYDGELTESEAINHAIEFYRKEKGKNEFTMLK